MRWSARRQQQRWQRGGRNGKRHEPNKVWLQKGCGWLFLPSFFLLLAANHFWFAETEAKKKKKKGEEKMRKKSQGFVRCAKAKHRKHKKKSPGPKSGTFAEDVAYFPGIQAKSGGLIGNSVRTNPGMCVNYCPSSKPRNQAGRRKLVGDSAERRMARGMLRTGTRKGGAKKVRRVITTGKTDDGRCTFEKSRSCMFCELRLENLVFPPPPHSQTFTNRTQTRAKSTESLCFRYARRCAGNNRKCAKHAPNDSTDDVTTHMHYPPQTWHRVIPCRFSLVFLVFLAAVARCVCLSCRLQCGDFASLRLGWVLFDGWFGLVWLLMMGW